MVMNGIQVHVLNDVIRFTEFKDEAAAVDAHLRLLGNDNAIFRNYAQFYNGYSFDPQMRVIEIHLSDQPDAEVIQQIINVATNILVPR